MTAATHKSLNETQIYLVFLHHLNTATTFDIKLWNKNSTVDVNVSAFSCSYFLEILFFFFSFRKGTYLYSTLPRYVL